MQMKSSEWPQPRTWMTPNADEDVDQQELPFTALKRNKLSSCGKIWSNLKCT